MHELTVAEIAHLDGRRYVAEIKKRLRDDAAWLDMIDPYLVERTRWTLNNMIESIDKQKARVLAEDSESDDRWLTAIDALRRYVKMRLTTLPPSEGPRLSKTKEARLWRALSAQLAEALAQSAPEALHQIQMPYGGQSAAEWLQSRQEKKAKQ